MKQEKTNIRRSVHALRRTLLLALLAAGAGVAAVAPAHGQTGTPPGGRFEWVKSYSGQESGDYYWNYITGSATDSQGNLYVSGNFAYGATIDGEDLLPFTPYGGRTDNPNGCILKIAPSGEILWKKVLHSNIASSNIYDIQLVGDSALYVNAYLAVPPDYGIYNNNEYLYLYDTLITASNAGGLLYTDSLYGFPGTVAISVLDLDGHLTENYILYMAYKDSAGRLITGDIPSGNDFDSIYIMNDQFKPGCFHVDNEGNIYYGHLMQDMVQVVCDTCEYGMQTYNMANGLLSEAVILVNGRQRFFYRPEGYVTHLNYKILKFAPHMEALLGCRYVFHEEPDDGHRWTHYKFDLTSDRDGNVFLLGNLNGSNTRRIPLSGDTSLGVNCNNSDEGMVIKYDRNLTPLNVIQTDVRNTTVIYGTYLIEPDSNSIMVFSSLGFLPDDYGLPVMVGQDTLHNIQGGRACFMRIDNETGRLQSYGYIPISPQADASAQPFTSFCTMKDILQPIAQGNRIITHVEYRGGIQVGDSAITLPPYKCGNGLYMCDYEGHFINHIDYGIASASSRCISSKLSMHDSILYVAEGYREPLVLGGTRLTPSGNSMAFMACYVDSSLAAPYVRPTPQDTTGGVGIAATGHADGVAVYPNPATSRVHIALPGGGTASECIVISANGLRHRERVEAGSVDLGRYPSGVYYLEIITDNNIYKQKIIKL